MIVTFSVSNFRSFLPRETLSLVPSESIPPNDGHVVVLSKEVPGVLRTSVVYGANGAGKSNLFKALKCLCELALGKMEAKNEPPMQPFAFASLSESRTRTVFDLQFIEKGTLYRYYVETSPQGIATELLSKKIGGRFYDIFQNVLGKKGQRSTISFGPGFSGRRGKRLAALSVVGAPIGQTFLSSVVASTLEQERGRDFENVIQWFTNILLISPQDRLTSLLLAYKDEQLRSFASSLLDPASGIASLVLEKEPLTEEDIRAMMQENSAEETIRKLSTDKHPQLLRNPRSGAELQIEKSDESGYGKITLKASHNLGEGRRSELDISEESDGTKRLAELIPALSAIIYQNRVCVIDEVERSMHTLLCRAFLRIFLESGKAGQLVLMTHADGLLDDSLLRKDEVWFVEKDSMSQSHLYSLNEFRERHKATLRQYYFQGRYGAIPSGFKTPPGESAQAKGGRTE